MQTRAEVAVECITQDIYTRALCEDCLLLDGMLNNMRQVIDDWQSHSDVVQAHSGVSERIEWVCRPLGIRTTFKPRGTLREALVQTKEPQPVWKKRGDVYQIPCAECVYIGGGTRRMLEKRLSEHKGAVKRNDTENGIAVHVWKTPHKVDWEAATVKQVETNYTHEEGQLIYFINLSTNYSSLQQH